LANSGRRPRPGDHYGADLVALRNLSGAITLAGITRRTVIELVRQAGQPLEEGLLSPATC
jgi:hypothetical protein